MFRNILARSKSFHEYFSFLWLSSVVIEVFYSYVYLSIVFFPPQKFKRMEVTKRTKALKEIPQIYYQVKATLLGFCHHAASLL